jgi:hypothetical protein
MWIFTETGFISAVRKTESPNVITVRSRDRDSLEPLASAAGVEIARSPYGDYPYRAFIQPEVFAGWVSEAASSIEYSNFKSHIAHTRDRDYAHHLGEVWSVMLHTEDEDARIIHQA